MEKYIQDRQNSIINNITKSFDNREEIIKGLDGEIIVYDEIYTPESINQFQKDLNKAFSNGKLTQEEFEKGKKDLSRLAMRQVFDKNGHKRIVYVKIHEDEHGKTHETDFDKDDDVKFAKDGKEFSGKIKSLKFHDKTDKVGTAMVEVDGKTYSVSLSKLEHNNSKRLADKPIISSEDGKTIITEAQANDPSFSINKKEERKNEYEEVSTEEFNYGPYDFAKEVLTKREISNVQGKTRNMKSLIKNLQSAAEQKIGKTLDEFRKEKFRNKSKLDIHEDGKKIAKFHGLSDKEYSAMHPDSKTEMKNSYEKYKEESSKQNNDILKRSQEAKKLREENTIMQEVGGQDGWNGKAKAIHLAKYIGKDEDFIKNLNQWKVGSSTIDTKLKGLEKEYLDWEKTKIDNATITYKNKFDEIVTTETKGMTPKEIKNHIGGDIISIKSSKKEEPKKLKEEKTIMQEVGGEDKREVLQSRNDKKSLPKGALGLTRNGHVVYENNKKADHKAYEHFTIEDHQDAANLHKQKQAEYQEQWERLPYSITRTSGTKGYRVHPIDTKRNTHGQRAIEHGFEISRLKRENKVNKSIDKNDIEKAFNTLSTF